MQPLLRTHRVGSRSSPYGDAMFSMLYDQRSFHGLPNVSGETDFKGSYEPPVTPSLRKVTLQECECGSDIIIKQPLSRWVTVARNSPCSGQETNRKRVTHEDCVLGHRLASLMISSQYRPRLNPRIRCATLSCVLLHGLRGWSPCQRRIARDSAKAHSITIDATSLVSQSWGQVPGVTPSIWTSDPEASDANRISERRDPQLKSGR